MKICKLRHRWAAKRNKSHSGKSLSVLGNEVADNDSSIRGQWYLKNLTLELSPVSMMFETIPKMDMFYITDCE